VYGIDTATGGAPDLGGGPRPDEQGEAEPLAKGRP